MRSTLIQNLFQILLQLDLNLPKFRTFTRYIPVTEDPTPTTCTCTSMYSYSDVSLIRCTESVVSIKYMLLLSIV